MSVFLCVCPLSDDKSLCHDIVKVTVESTSHRRVISTANFDNYCKILSCIHFKPKWSQTMSDDQPGGCVNFKEE